MAATLLTMAVALALAPVSSAGFPGPALEDKPDSRATQVPTPGLEDPGEVPDRESDLSLVDDPPDDEDEDDGPSCRPRCL